jgi:Protein implicated in ribosomal biogenesis, Nop56p homolog
MLYQSNLFHTGMREFTATSDLSDILPEEVEAKVKEAAEISMGTEISEDDIQNIQHLCDQVSILRSSVATQGWSATGRRRRRLVFLYPEAVERSPLDGGVDGA